MSAEAGTPARVEQAVSEGLHTVTLHRSGLKQLFITALPAGGANFRTMFAKSIEAVQAAGATVLAQDVFGVPAVEEAAMAALADVCGAVDWPVTWLEEGASVGTSLTGTQIYAVAGPSVERIELDGRVVGSVFENEYARHCRLGDLRPANTSGSREQQSRETFDLMMTALAAAGMDFSNVVRTWLYLDDLLDWYDPFNRVRDEFFKEHGVFDGVVPASTGIGGANAAGAAIVADAYAVQPRCDQVKVFPVTSPLQCPALEYGSSFSRAVEVAMPDHRRLFVSGSASIEPGGKTVHLDDVAAQIDLTMRVVAAILESRQMAWADVTRGIAYIKDGKDVPVYARYCRENQLPTMPTVVVENDVCRHDLLFEIEVDAATGC